MCQEICMFIEHLLIVTLRERIETPLVRISFFSKLHSLQNHCLRYLLLNLHAVQKFQYLQLPDFASKADRLLIDVLTIRNIVQNSTISRIGLRILDLPKF